MRKRILSLTVVLSMVLAMIPAFSLTASAAFDNANGGSGTADDPYEIATADQLGAFRDYINGDEDGGKDEYFKMTADIDLGGGKWTQIGTRDIVFKAHLTAAVTQ